MGLPRSVVVRLRRAAEADGARASGLTALLSVHALQAAGDALVAIALADTLFFAVPIGEARSRVALYLLLTLLPFTFLVPVAGPLLDRFRHGRRNVLALTTGGRGLLTWVMAGATASLGLYPMALAVLVLSRAYGVARSAAVPRVRPQGLGLVQANARLNVAAVGTATVAAGGGALLVRALGSPAALYLASGLLIVAGVLALRLPDQVDEAPAPWRAAAYRLRAADPRVLRALAAATTVRAVAGILTIFLAFLLRATGSSALDVVLVVGTAAAGQLLGTTTAARLPGTSTSRMPLLPPALTLAGCLAAVLFPAVGVIALAAGLVGMSVSVSKFVLDAGLQSHVAVERVSSAFARAETALQLSWVLGAATALLLPENDQVGFALAAVVAAGGLAVAVRALRPNPTPPRGR